MENEKFATRRKEEAEAKMEAAEEREQPAEKNLEKLPALEKMREQYDSQVKIFEKTGILREFKNGQKGIIDIDGNERPVPSFENMIREARKDQDFRAKEKQGLSKLLVCPFGMKISDLATIYGQLLAKHHREGKLFMPRKDSSNPEEIRQTLKLNENQPVHIQDDYKDADTTGKIVYFTENLSKDSRGGKTKRDILKQSETGFGISLVEDLPVVPKEGNGETIGDRKQIEAGETPNRYMEMIKSEQAYRGERGMTPEEMLTLAIIRLEETDEATDIDDCGENSSASYLLGAFFPNSGTVPRFCFDGNDGQAYLGTATPEGCDENDGPRMSMPVGKI